VPIAASAVTAMSASAGVPLDVVLESGMRFMPHATLGCTAVQPRERRA